MSLPLPRFGFTLQELSKILREKEKGSKRGPRVGKGVFTFAFQTGKAKARALFGVVRFSRRCVFPTEES